jgi:hypothetical protein
LRIRSLVGVIPLFAVEVLEQNVIDALPGFRKRLQWFLENRQDLARHIAYLERAPRGAGTTAVNGSAAETYRLLAIPSRERLVRMLRYVLDESEFLSPFGVRSLSRVYADQPYSCMFQEREYRVGYTPGESNSNLFGGNSNWRGPIWFPLNYLLIESLERYYHFYGDTLQVECPTGSGRQMNLLQVAQQIASRLQRLFLPDADGRRPLHGADSRYAHDPHWKDLVLFYEYFHGDNGRGVGANHQTGWTALVVRLMATLARDRAGTASGTPHRRQAGFTGFESQDDVPTIVPRR